MTPAPCEVQMALVAINVKHSICPRWQFAGWWLWQVAVVV